MKSFILCGSYDACCDKFTQNTDSGLFPVSGMAAVILVWEEKESLCCKLCWVTSPALRG